MSITYFFLFLLVHPYLALWWKSFEQAGRKPWEALVPGYNYFIAFKVFCHKPFWALLMLFPGVHLAMWASLNVSYIRRFGYYSFVDTLQGIFFPYVIFYKISSSKKDFLPETNWANSRDVEIRKWGDHIVLFMSLPIIGHVVALALGAVTREKPGKKSKVKEWGDSLLFALVAASIIRTYVFEPFQIPTGSMEKTLLVGDFLFVNKLAYGPKVPVTPLSYPLVHNTVPWVNIKSYTTFEKGTYTRLPGFGKVNRNDVLVFNYPSGDTAVYDPRMPNGLMGHDYYQILNDEAFFYWRNTFERNNSAQVNAFFQNAGADQNKAFEMYIDSFGMDFFNNINYWKNIARTEMALGKTYCRGGMPERGLDHIEHYGLVYRPVDKRENYIKRCVAIAGDWIEIKSSKLYVNGKPAWVAPEQNLQYFVSNIALLSDNAMRDKFGLESPRGDYFSSDGGKTYTMNLTKSEKIALEKYYPNAKFEMNLMPQYSDDKGENTPFRMLNNLGNYPKDPKINNTTTDYSKIQIPFKGQTVKINSDNIAWFRRVITAYEGHKLEERKDGIYIDGTKRSTYTFAMNYYWLMGDNRYNSADSRVWGFVPEDHVVGRASMVWFSKSPDYGIRWERLFKMIR